MAPEMPLSDSQRVKFISLSMSSPRTSYPPTANSATLPNLPTELVIEIFKAADSIATASNLSKVSHRLFSVWNDNIDTILCSYVDCYPQAQELAQALEKGRSWLRLPAPPRMDSTRTQYISINAKLSSSILQRYEIRVISDSTRLGMKRDELLPNERITFVRASYRAMTLAATANCRELPHSFFESLDMLDYMQLREALGFVRFWVTTEMENPQNHNLHLKISHLSRAVHYAEKELMYFHRDLMRLPVDLGVFKYGDPASCDFYFTVADGYLRVQHQGEALSWQISYRYWPSNTFGAEWPFQWQDGMCHVV